MCSSVCARYGADEDGPNTDAYGSSESMTTNTCLIGGSFFAGLPAAASEEPFELLELSVELGSELPELSVELGCVFVGLVPVLAPVVGVGVASGSTCGGSPPDVEADASEPDGCEPLAPVVGMGPEAGSMTFNGERAAASEPLTLVLATSPMRMPNPRNISTSNAETRGAGSRRPPCGEAGISATGAGATGALGPSAVAAATGEAPRVRCNSSSNCPLRGPTRAPHARQ